MSQDQGSVAIVEETDRNEARAPQTEPRADLLERLFVDEERSMRYMRRRFGVHVDQELLDLGLEVEGDAPDGCTSSWDHVATLPPQESYAAIEDCVVDYLLEHPTADHSRIRMFA